MHKLGFLVAVFTATIVSGGLVDSASAQPLHAQEGSVLIFPLFNSTAGNNTLLTVTNTNEDESLCRGSAFRHGDVQLHYTYFSDVWAQSDTDENLTPADTLTVLARGHNPNDEIGFLIVEARDPETNFPLVFNHLIGSAIVVNSEFDFQWSYTPYAFVADFFLRSDCENYVDVPSDPDFDTMDFDGREYSAFPEFLYLDHFFGEGTPAGNPAVSFSNTLYLMSTSPGGPEVEDMTSVFIQGYNNNERGFSRTFRFNCYTVTTLNDLTGATTQSNLATNGDAGELGGIAYGWLKMGALNTGEAFGGVPVDSILGVYAHRVTIGSESFVAGRELQYSGSRSATLPRTF